MAIARGGRARWWVLGLVVAIVLVGLSTQAHATWRRYSDTQAREHLCQDYALLRYALLSDSIGSSATVRYRASRVARQAQFASAAPQRDALPANTAAGALEELLSVPFANQVDFRTKVWPVAHACGAATRDYPYLGPTGSS